MSSAESPLSFRPLVEEATRLGSTAAVLLQKAAHGEVALYWRLPAGARRRQMESREQYDDFSGSTELRWATVFQGDEPVYRDDDKPLTFKLDVALSPELVYWFANGCDPPDAEHFEPPLLKDVVDGTVWQIPYRTGDPFEVPRLPLIEELYVEIINLSPKKAGDVRRSQEAWFAGFFRRNNINPHSMPVEKRGVKSAIKSAAQKEFNEKFPTSKGSFRNLWQDAICGEIDFTKYNSDT